MMYMKYLWGVLFVTLLSSMVESRRVNVAPPASEDGELDTQQTTDDERQFKPVLIARRPLQQRRPLADAEAERQQVVVVRQSPRLLQRSQEQEAEAEDDEQQVIIRQQPVSRPAQQQRSQPPAQQLIQQRLKEQPQQQKETAQTIRNYNKLNDDGSFTFGYEADDGSFKEETRGTDCVVRGKYGYVDPDGNKREFSYVQGNPCDPNAVSNEDEADQPTKPDEEENIPANIPNVPRPKPKKNRPTTTLFQQSFGDFEQPQQEPQPQQFTTPRQPGRQQQQVPQEASRRPPQVLPLAERPSTTAAPPQFRPSAAAENLESAIRNLPQPSGKSQQIPSGSISPQYTTELVFDPATGQYNTVIFQQVPREQAGININQRLPLQVPARQPQPQPQFQPHSPPQFQPQPQPQFKPTLQPQFQPQQRFQPQTQLQPRPQFQPQPQFQSQFQSQRPIEFDFQRPAAAPQSALTFQQPQSVFRQQQKQQLQQPFQPQSAQFFPPPSQRFATDPSQQFAPLPKQQRFEQQPEAQQQQFVLVQPGRTPGQQSLAAGQIDAFLRGHNVQF